jgi:hypothetical protein
MTITDRPAQNDGSARNGGTADLDGVAPIIWFPVQATVWAAKRRGGAIIGIVDKTGDRYRSTDASGVVLGEFISLDDAKEALEE